MKTKLLALVLLAGSAAVAGPRVFFGVGIGAPVYAPAPVAPIAAYVPPAPGPGYSWVAGYWYPVGARRVWHAGYWAPRPYVGRYYAGRWRR